MENVSRSLGYASRYPTDIQRVFILITGKSKWHRQLKPNRKIPEAGSASLEFH